MATGWAPTGSLARSTIVASVGLVGAVVTGRPTLLVVVAPLVVATAMGLARRPTSSPVVRAELGHLHLSEGQGTVSRLVIAEAEGAEQVTRVAVREPFVRLRPGGGRINRLVGEAPTELQVSPRRWGWRTLGREVVALTSPWAGFRYGPVTLTGHQVRVLPAGIPYGSHAEQPQPRGLVGAHRSVRTGSGTEFAGIRGFEPGDRLRRINWRVSARSGRLHVTTTRAEEDAGVLLVVDALTDHGRSGGLDGDESSLDRTVRAAAAVAEHAVRQGDRVSLRVVGSGTRQLAPGAGWSHLRRLLGALSTLRPAGEEADGIGPRLRGTEGTMVVVLSPMLAEALGTLTATALRRGLPTLVIDTLPEDAAPGVSPDADPVAADLAWRMRRLEREQVLAGLAALGCPVVPWRGPGTIDEVTRRLARRAQQPRVAVR
jgi:uncharacterized protein (DUF58 family)